MASMFINRLFSQKANAIAAGLILLLALAYLDLVTGYDLGFFVFYFIPISMIAWYAGRPLAIAISLFAAIAWLLIDKFSGHPYSNLSFPYWNAFVRWTSFVILAIAISEIKTMLEKEKRLKLELSQALHKIKQFIAVARKVAEGDLLVTMHDIDKENADSVDESFNFMLKRLTEQKNLEKRLFQLERQAIMAETASHFAHEIRNPLNLIMLTAHHIGNQFVPSDEAKRKHFDELIVSLKSEVEQLSKVVSEFMTIGKPSELHKNKCILSDIVNQIRVLIKQQLTSKNISFECLGDISMGIYADPEQLKLVFLNLFVNAVAAVPQDGKIWFHAGRDSAGKTAMLSICDNGQGIREEDLEKIFEPYFTRRPDGTGLGLSLVKRIIEEHDGTIRSENRPEGGARFQIILPIKD
jgi:signal transduction histidine kinase